MARVRVNSKYVFNPVPLDCFDSRHTAKVGQVVRVVNLHGAPKANTMGHCYINSLQGYFLGLVSTNSLVRPPKDYPHDPVTGFYTGPTKLED